MYLTLNSEFRPFTYDELVKPLSDYTEAYNKVEEQYSTLAQQTEAWKNIATQENSPEAYAMYKRYSDELNAVVEDFSRGMTVQNRSKLAGLKSRYNAEIGAIDQAYKAMQIANAYRDQILLKDPSAIFITDRYHSIDDFLGGQSPNNSYISGKQLESTLLGKAYAKANSKFTELIGTGISEEDAIKYITSGQAFSIDDIVNSELEELGIQDFDETSRNKLRTYVNSGVTQGFSSFVDKQTLTEAQRADNELRRASITAQYASIEEQRRQFNANLAAKGLNTDGSINPNSPVWQMEGITFSDNKDGTTTITSINGDNTRTITIDASIAVNTKYGVAIMKDEEISNIRVKKFSDLPSDIQNKLSNEFNLLDTTGLQIDEITSKNNNNKWYRPHISKDKEIPIGNPEEIISDVDPEELD